MFDFCSVSVCHLCFCLSCRRQWRNTFIYLSKTFRSQWIVRFAFNFIAFAVHSFVFTATKLCSTLAMCISMNDGNKHGIREKKHTRTKHKWLYLLCILLCDKGRNWKKIWIWKFTTWSYFKWYRILVRIRKGSLIGITRVRVHSHKFGDISFEWWTNKNDVVFLHVAQVQKELLW